MPPKPHVNADGVRSALEAMEKGSATGPDRAGVRWLLLVADIEHIVHPDFSGLELLALVVKKLAAGEFTPEVGHLISASNLIALDKGGAKIRPISIDVVMRRLITKALMPASIAEARENLAPLQVGCGVKAGLDAIVHDTRGETGKLGHDPAYIGVSVDACNAFNRKSRAEMLRQTAEHSRSLNRFANALYAEGQPFLRLGEKYLPSQEGAQQGDPASSLMFALAIDLIAQRIEAECDLIVHIWYADDGLLVGKIDQVKRALEIIAEHGVRISFIIQSTKTKAFWPTQNSLLLAPLTKAYDLDLRPPSDGFKILGVPLGSPAFVLNFIRKKMDAVDASPALTATIPDGRIGHNVHRVTASACRMTHLLRLTRPAEAMALWRDLEGRQRA